LKYLTIIGICTLFCSTALANQQYKPLSASVSAALHRSVADTASPRLAFEDEMDGKVWLADMSSRLRQYIHDDTTRRDFLVTAHYEATRAGLDPQMVLALIEVESAFRKYAVSKSGARGYMQVMPFWVTLLDEEDSHNLFNLRTNLRYGCVILRHYVDIERGNLFRALGRYNGSLGRAKYPDKVLRAWNRHWKYEVEEPKFTRTSD
jgi:soluble lytic murein transglycosylase-like protein